MDDQKKSDEEKEKIKKEEYKLRIDPVCGYGAVKIENDKKDKDKSSSWDWV